ncbi:MAG TPA: FAD-dependent monooxygenase [Roseiarcus sp.]|nr:FAD-dependent monooxygenase [Roseiarcus sp.]
MRQISNDPDLAGPKRLDAAGRQEGRLSSFSASGPVEPGEILVAGAGIVGLAAAIGLAAAGFETILCGAPERLASGRTVALLGASTQFLASLGVREDIERRGAPLRALRIIDDTGSLWRAPTIEFYASEIGLDCFGWNIENALLVDALAAQAARRSNLRMIASRIIAYEWGARSALARCEDGRTIEARLVVAADGRGSPARTAANIATRVHRLPQTALTTILAHSRSHAEFSSEFHTRTGPFTLVPLPAGNDGAQRSSLVWVMSERQSRRRAALEDVRLAAEIETQAQSIHGAMRIAGGRGVFPLVSQTAIRLTAPRLALVGDAAHVLPPIGAQGLNLGLRDAAWLIETIEATRRAGRDAGAPETLARYEASRRGDVGSRSVVINALNFSLISGFGLSDLARSAGLAALGAIGPLRRFAMREGMSPSWALPRAMRG